MPAIRAAAYFMIQAVGSELSGFAVGRFKEAIASGHVEVVSIRLIRIPQGEFAAATLTYNAVQIFRSVRLVGSQILEEAIRLTIDSLNNEPPVQIIGVVVEATLGGGACQVDGG